MRMKKGEQEVSSFEELVRVLEEVKAGELLRIMIVTAGEERDGEEG